MAEKTRKIIDAHGHLVQYIAGTAPEGNCVLWETGWQNMHPERGSVFSGSSLTMEL